MNTLIMLADHPVFKEHLQKISPPTYLFQEADPAENAYLIISGYVELTAAKGNKQHLVSFLGPGQILGEAVIMGLRDAKRAFGARAHSDLRFVEISPRLVATLKKEHPALMSELYYQVANISLGRLKRANFLVRGFRSTDKVERMIRLIYYLCDSFGREGLNGREVYLPHHLMNYYMDIPQFEFADLIQGLIKKQVIVPKDGDCYEIPDMALLKQKLPQLVDDLPGFPMI